MILVQGLLIALTVRHQPAGNQSEPTDQQNEHHQRVKKAGWLKVDTHVGDHAGENEKRSAHCQHPSNDASPLPEQNAHAEQQRDQGDAKTIRSPQVPVGAHHADLIGNQVSSHARHGAANQELGQSTGRSPNVA